VKRILTSGEMRAVDQAAGEHGMPPAVLMENAGAALAEAALALAGPQGRFFVLCGSGNNGGDGMVAARKLAALGRVVFVETTVLTEALEGEAHRVSKAMKASGLTPMRIPEELGVGQGDVVIDALLGIGLSRAPEGKVAEAIGKANAWRTAGAKIVAADLPSGLASDSGLVHTPCVTADVTVAFGFLKAGQVREPGASQCGHTTVADIGIPKAALAVLKDSAVHLLEEADVRERIPRRAPTAHKGTQGHVLLVAGSWGKTGAAALAGMAALRSGAGLVTVATRPEALVPVMAHAPELMGVELVSDGPLGQADLNSLLEAADGKDAVVIGPGMPRGEETAKLLGAFLEELSVPCVLDADALNALAGNLDVLQRAKGELLLTPHPGEMARLVGKSIEEVQSERVRHARELAQSSAVTVILKGARTVIAQTDGQVFLNPTGNPGMATGGTGDVLAGMCGALLAQGLTPESAALTATYAHGLAGDLAAAQRSLAGLTAMDVVGALGDVWRRWNR